MNVSPRCIAGGVLLLAAALGAAERGVARAAAAERDRPPNIVFSMADDLGWGDVGCYGATAVKTPHVDRIAEQGIRFTDAHSETACCTPTRYGVLTGRYSWRTSLKSGVLPWTGSLMIERERLTVAAMLKSAGYATACVGKWHLGIGRRGRDWSGELKPGPLEVGFDYYFGMPGSNHGLPVLVENHRLVDPADAGRIPRFDDAELRRRKQEEIGPAMTEKAVRFVEEHADEPFFLYYTPCAIHTPYTPAPPFQKTSQMGARGDFIHQLDWSVGQVLAALDRAGVAGQTLVIFTSDNGGDRPFSTGPFRAHKTSVYEGGHRVPFVARWPGRIAPATVCRKTICLNDLLATCAAILRRQLPDGAGEDSFNILPLLLGREPEGPMRPGMVNKACRGPELSIRRGPWKLVLPKGFWPTAEGVAALRGGELPAGELYDLDSDPAEKTDVREDHPEIAEQLRELMIRFVRQGRSRP